MKGNNITKRAKVNKTVIKIHENNCHNGLTESNQLC